MNGEGLFSGQLSEVFHALSAPRRCWVIQLLAESDEDTLSVRHLARNIAAIEEGVPTECATGEPYRNVYNALSQTHLSTLADTDIIIYDSDRQTIAAGPKFDVAALLVVLNRATYQTLQGDSIPEPANFDSTSTTD